LDSSLPFLIFTCPMIHSSFIPPKQILICIKTIELVLVKNWSSSMFRVYAIQGRGKIAALCWGNQKATFKPHVCCEFHVNLQLQQCLWKLWSFG
jgi:hypothetical protein